MIDYRSSLCSCGIALVNGELTPLSTDSLLVSCYDVCTVHIMK